MAAKQKKGRYEKCRNLFGPLSPDVKARLDRVIENPTNNHWEDAYSIIIGADGWMTLWQAVRAVSPAFPFSKPCDEPWPVVPDSFTIRRALKHAQTVKGK